MIQGKQFARGIRGIRLLHEALTNIFLTIAEAFATKNSLPWLTDETKQATGALKEPFRPNDANSCVTTISLQLI